MIAVPRADGGVTVHGSLQCPYYVHKALKRGLGLDAERAQVVQAETGGGFGGKEEYPSMIGLHAALLARKTGRPVRMIYDRHEDLAATTKRHPAIVTHRTGVMLDGRIVAQDIELVMDGGAYTTLTPVVLSRATIHAGGPYDVPNVRIRSRAVATNTPPNGAFRGFGAPQSEFAAETQLNRIAEAIGLSPLEIRRRNVYRLGGITPTHQVLRSGVAGEEVLERAAEASEFERVRARTAESRTERSASDRSAARHRPRPGLARGRLHGLGRGEDGLGREPRADRRGPDPDPHGVDRDGPGHEDDLPPDRGRRARPGHRRGRDRPAGHGDRPGFRSDGRVADRDGRRRDAHRGGPSAPHGGRGANRSAVRRELRGRCPEPRHHPDRPVVRALSGRRLR